MKKIPKFWNSSSFSHAWFIYFYYSWTSKDSQHCKQCWWIVSFFFPVCRSIIQQAGFLLRTQSTCFNTCSCTSGSPARTRSSSATSHSSDIISNDNFVESSNDFRNKGHDELAVTGATVIWLWMREVGTIVYKEVRARSSQVDFSDRSMARNKVSLI